MTSAHEQEALKHFKRVDPILYAAARKFKGTLHSRLAEKRGKDRLFSTLAASVVSQQLSTKAADTIWKRLQEACGGAVTANSVLATPLPAIRAAGLSGAKARTITEMAAAVKNGLDLPALRRMPESDAVMTLTAIWGVGMWTAEMFLIFALGRLDVFSPKDLGLIRAIEDLYGVERNSKTEVYVEISERWAPYRSLASLALWRTRDGN